MWFKVEVAALDDPRIALLGVRLQISDGDAFKACCRVWAWLYQRGPGVLAEDEVNAVSRYSGFAEQLVKSGLADATPEGVRIHGEWRAERYLEYCAKQKERAIAREEAKRSGANNRPPPVPPAVAPKQHQDSSVDLSDLVRKGSSLGSSQKPISSVALDLAEYLYTAIRSHSPEHQGNPERWARDIDLALRRDSLTPEQLRSVVDYAHRNPDGSFWASNLLSGAKLRKHAPALLIRLRKAPGGSVAGGSDGGRVMTADELAAWSLEQMAREREEGKR